MFYETKSRMPKQNLKCIFNLLCQISFQQISFSFLITATESHKMINATKTSFKMCVSPKDLS